MADDVRLTDLEVIQRYSIAVRGETADRTELVEALRSDLAFLERASRPAPARNAPARNAPARPAAPAKPAAKKSAVPTKPAAKKSAKPAIKPTPYLPVKPGAKAAPKKSGRR